MIVIPAVDIKDGRCVRLEQGRPERLSVYGDDPAAIARHWAGQGASWLHVVDLDGAFAGRPVNRDAVRAVIRAAGVPVQVGGGIRQETDIERLVAEGAARVVLGTRAVRDPAWLSAVVRRWGERIAVAIDVSGGRLAVEGWRRTGAEDPIEFARRLVDCGVSTIIYTDVSRDGTRRGINVAAVGDLCDRVSAGVIASGGVGSAEDVRALRRLGRRNLAGVIVGKALYEGSVTLQELKEAAGEEA